MTAKQRQNKVDLEIYDVFDLLGVDFPKSEKNQVYSDLTILIFKEFILTYVPGIENKKLLEQMSTMIEQKKDMGVIFTELSKHIPSFLDDLIAFTNIRKKKFIESVIKRCITDLEMKKDHLSEREDIDETLNRLQYYHRALELCTLENWKKLYTHTHSLPHDQIGKKYISQYSIKKDDLEKK